MPKRRPKPRPPGPDDDLAPEQFPDLNRQFYSAKLEPHAYLMHRYRGLFLAAQAPEALPCSFDNELAIGELRATWSSIDGEWDAVEMRDYVSTESTVLLHHSTEALFRLYFAHVDSPECPWLGVARLRLPRQFKERLSRFLSEWESEEAAESAMFVFYGRRTVDEEKRERWDSLRDGLMLLLTHLGRRWLSEAALYNSAKHGLSLVPGAATMQFGDQSGPLPIRADGPSITYLTVLDKPHGKRWAQETVWLEPARTLAVVALAQYQLSNLWHVAQCRYADHEWDQSEMRYMDATLVGRVLYPEPKAKVATFTVPSMSIDLLYYEVSPPDL